VNETEERRELRAAFRRNYGRLFKRLALLIIGIAVVVALVTIGGDDGFGQIDPDNPARAYFLVFFFVAMDAVVPVFPGETTLNAASAFAAAGDLELWLIIVLGALGAIIGDSSLYWIARKNSERITPQLERARSNRRVDTALAFVDRGAPVMLVFGRYVPGLRFVINSTMGMTEYPYRDYLPWSALGGIMWSAYTCLLAYWVGSTLDNYPLASVYISAAITTIAMAIIFLVVRRRSRGGPRRTAPSLRRGQRSREVFADAAEPERDGQLENASRQGSRPDPHDQ
jgi:membrane protein DedA with SNARE-associated domain